jgi:uncharacterized membrane protein YgcG
MISRVATALISATASLLILSGCSAGTGTGQEQIDSLAVDYTIEASGTMHAVEKINYDFGAELGRHGIDRFLASRFTTSDGTERVYRYSDVSVTSPSGASALFSTSLSNALQIRIGNKNATVSGKQSYVISYDIAGALNSPTMDSGMSVDEFYWNVTGNYWNVPIDKTTVRVHGPTDTTQIACYTGTSGSTAKCADATAVAGGAHFSDGRIFPGEGITIDLAWPNGTFENTAAIIEQPLAPGAVVTGGSNDGPNPFWSPWNWGTGLVLLFGIPFLFRLLVFLRRRDQRFVGVTPGGIPADPHTAPTEKAPLHETIVVEYQPPKDFPVGAAGSVLNKTRKPTDITATLIDLAVRGHLRIEEVGKGGGLARSNFRLVATPDRVLAKEQAAAHSGSPKPPPLLIHEQQLLSNLFDNGRTTVTLADLRNTFSSEMRMIGGSLDGWIERGGFFVDKFTGRHPVPLVVIAASVLTFIAMAVLQASFLAIPAGAAIGSAVVLGWSKKAVRRSALGHALYLQLEGFRLYIATAEADRIRFDEQDDVFSRYMPWAIVFGESERWARVFKDLAEQGKFTEVPDWYTGSSGFSTGYLAGSMASMASIGSAMSSFSSIAGSAMTSTPASSGSSGFSSSGGGGGSSGGGGGGGGGGSW